MGAYTGYDTSESKLVSVRIRMDVFERIEEISETEARSRSQIVNSLLAKSLGLDRYKMDKKACRNDRDRMEILETAVTRLAQEVVRLKKEVANMKRSDCAIDIDEI